MHCPKCSGEAFHKDGVIKGRQRYRCKGCDCRFTQSRRHGHGLDKKLQALALYREGLGFRAIGRLLGVSNVAVLKWIRAFADETRARMLCEPLDLKDMDVVVLDELWHYTQKNSASSGYGLLYLCAPDGSSPSRWALVVPKQPRPSGGKSPKAA